MSCYDSTRESLTALAIGSVRLVIMDNIHNIVKDITVAKKKREKKSKQPSQFSEHFGFRLREGYLLMLWALSVFVF